MGKSYHVLDLGGVIPQNWGNLPQKAISNDSNYGRNMPGNELIFAWLLTIDKSYDVLHLGRGTPNGGNLAQKMKFRMTRIVAKIFKGST